MANPRIKINHAALEQIKQEAIAKLQPEYDAALRDVVRGVRDDMEGQPAEKIYAELVRRLQAEMPGMQPNEENLRRVAQEISDGTLTG